MTALSTVDEGDARLSNLRAFVRCSLRITAARPVRKWDTGRGGFCGEGGTFVPGFP
jgi:hypothetical protein